jgi:hypothetical protein
VCFLPGAEQMQSHNFPQVQSALPQGGGRVAEGLEQARLPMMTDSNAASSQEDADG